jgi:hypothetical protein
MSRLKALASHYLSAGAHHSSAFAWRANGVFARGVGKLCGLESPESTAFARKPFTHGVLPLSTVARLKTVILGAPNVEFRSDDHAPGYVFNPGGDALARGYNATCRFHRIGENQAHAIAAAIDGIASQITNKLGSGWRIINVRSWSLRSGHVSADNWHLDGFPPGTFKLMLYLTPVSQRTGTTEVRYDDGTTTTLEGEAGTYLLFDPSRLWHRAIPPAQPDLERTIIEVSLMRAPFTDRSLACAGLNSSYPFMPWAARPLLN